MHVVIVEDQPEMAKLLSQGLQEELFEISLARDGRSALEISAERRRKNEKAFGDPRGCRSPMRLGLCCSCQRSDPEKNHCSGDGGLGLPDRR